MQPLIVIVEDDPVISELIEYNLSGEGYRTIAFRDGKTMLENRNGLSGTSLFILDIMLPGMDGIEICNVIRSISIFKRVPVIMLTARGSETDKVLALETGADDYITKPFGVREFLARVRANIRRYLDEPSVERTYEASEPVSASKDTISISGIILDDVRHRVFRNGGEILMTNREYELLKFLMRNRGIAFSREDLLQKVWGYEYAGETRTVDVHIRQLRKKIGDDSDIPSIIETIRGRGYRFSDRT